MSNHSYADCCPCDRCRASRGRLDSAAARMSAAMSTDRLSDRARPNSEAAPWVIDEIKRLERDLAAAVARAEAAERERDYLRSQADRFSDGIDWIQRAMQAEALLDQVRELAEKMKPEIRVLTPAESAAIDAAMKEQKS